MDKTIENILDDVFNIKTLKSYQFKTLHGLTFAFEKKDIFINRHISSSSIKPVGIIFKENDEFVFTPLDETYNIDEIIKKYVEKVII